MLENAEESTGKELVAGTRKLVTELNDDANYNTADNAKSVQDSTIEHVLGPMGAKTVHCSQDNVSEKSLVWAMLGEQFTHLTNLTDILYF